MSGTVRARLRERRDEEAALAARHPGTMFGDWANLYAAVFDFLYVVATTIRGPE